MTENSNAMGMDSIEVTAHTKKIYSNKSSGLQTTSRWPEAVEFSSSTQWQFRNWKQNSYNNIKTRVFERKANLRSLRLAISAGDM